MMVRPPPTTWSKSASGGLPFNPLRSLVLGSKKPEDGVLKLFQGEEQRVNIIDTPGHVDFTAEVERSLRVLDGAIVVFCGVAGVQPQTETVWRQANKYDVPRIIFVNKMDRVGADFNAVVEEVREKLGANALPILIPLGSEDSLRGQLDVINQKAVIYTEDDLLGSTYTVRDLEGDEVELGKAAYAELLEAVAGNNDELGEKFLMEEEITPSELKAALREATIANEIVPVAGGSAFKNKGVQYLLMRSPIIFRAHSILPLQWEWTPATRKKRFSSRLMMPVSFARWRSSSPTTSTSANSFSSASTLVLFPRVTKFSIPALAKRSAWAD